MSLCSSGVRSILIVELMVASGGGVWCCDVDLFRDRRTEFVVQPVGDGGVKEKAVQ